MHPRGFFTIALSVALTTSATGLNAQSVEIEKPMALACHQGFRKSFQEHFYIRSTARPSS